MTSIHALALSLIVMLVTACGGNTGESPCADHTDVEPCTEDQRCRWLVPGCTEPELPAPGCFPAEDCKDSSVCTEGRTCQERIYNPCWNSNCLACGASAQVCLH